MTSRRRKTYQGSDSAQVLALSLFLMLLAFFIVLSTLSTFDERKVLAVRDSVEDSFASDIFGVDGKPADEEGDDFDRDVGKAFDDLEAVLKAQIALISIKKEAEAGVMTVSLPEDAVFKDHLPPKNQILAAQIVKIITRSAGKSVGFRVEANTHFDREDKSSNDKVNGLGAFMRSMMQRGIDPHALSMGLKKGKQGYVDLIFYTYRRGDKPQPQSKPEEETLTGEFS